MDDQELAAIRAARLQQLQQQGGISNGGGEPEGEDPEAAAAQRRTEEEMKRAILAQILEPAARERLSRISLVSPTRVQQIENNLIRMARSGMQRITDDQFLNLLRQADEAQPSSKPSKIVFQRRKDIDSDDDFDL
ncbi:DNA-binding TFAR19-related protein [Schizopora paradoxa]|uniref:DNA-binding TFAR19-related protein n=1 Tax=Schizopora paradoxa TaxID=27342 RepID=A0A0H2RMG1_9AGAM|nr:DNA-binding TFAR19-related protein [Schizopora paradoxa]